MRLVAGEVVNLGRIALEPGGRLRGRVVDEQGLGIAGAIVTTREVGERRQELEMGRYLSAVHDRLREAQAPVAVSDGGGDFLLSGLGEGFVHLWARADGFLPTYTEPVEVRVGVETYGAEIVLARLGSANLVRGRVVTPDGQVVPFATLDYRERSAELGYGIANQKTTETDGSFEFVLPPDATLTLTARDPEDRFGAVTADEVKAGRLDVELREEDVLYSYLQQGPSLTDFEDEVRWNCLVEEGRTCFYDLRVGDPEAYRLEGRVTFDRAVPTTTVAWLAPLDASFLDNLGRWPTATVDPSGAFSLGSEEAGDYRLVLKSTSLSGEWVLVDEVHLEAATTTWERELALGSVAVDGVSAPKGDDLPPVVYRWNGPGRLMYLGLFAPTDDDVVRLDFVPAGPGALVRPTTAAIDDPASWEVLLEVRVVAGERTRVAAPR